MATQLQYLSKGSYRIIVPEGYQPNVSVNMWGAGGGDSGTNTGGSGAFVAGTFAVVPGDEIILSVGGAGEDNITRLSSTGAPGGDNERAGFNGGFGGNVIGATFINQQVVFRSGSGTWTVPDGVTKINVEMSGAGGGGGRYHFKCGGPTAHPGGRGGNGVRVTRTISVTPGQVLSYTIGDGGAGGTGTGSRAAGTGGTGGSTRLVVPASSSNSTATTIAAAGGTGGVAGFGDVGANGTGGSGASGGAGGSHRDNDPFGKAGRNGSLQISWSLINRGGAGGGGASTIQLNGQVIMVAAGGGGASGYGDNVDGADGLGGNIYIGLNPYSEITPGTNGGIGKSGPVGGGGGGGGFPKGGVGGAARTATSTRGLSAGSGGQSFANTSVVFNTTLTNGINGEDGGAAPNTSSKYYPRTPAGKHGYDGAIIIEFAKAFQISTKNAGSWDKIKNLWVKVNNEWRSIVGAWTKRENVWRPLTKAPEINAVALTNQEPERYPVAIDITANVNNWELAPRLFAAGYVPGSSDITVTVYPNVVVGSTSTSKPAMIIRKWNARDNDLPYPTADNPGLWAGDSRLQIAGDTITIVNNGYIVGAGGTGGTNAFNGGSGTAGGDALSVNYPCTIVNDGTIAGGGGGGAGTSLSTVPTVGDNNTNTWTWTTPGIYDFTVPTGTDKINVTVVGGGGGGGGWDFYEGAPGLAGDVVRGVLDVDGGETLQIYVGGGGRPGESFADGRGKAPGGAGGSVVSLLAPTQIPPSQVNLVANWTFRNRRGNRALCSINPRQQSATLDSGARFDIMPVKNIPALFVNGSYRGYAVVEDYTNELALTRTAGSSFTIEAWVYPVHKGQYKFYGGMIINHDQDFEVAIAEDGRVICAFDWGTGTDVNLPGGGWIIPPVNTATVPYNQPTHVAVVVDNTTLRIYLNGVSAWTKTGLDRRSSNFRNKQTYIGNRTSRSQGFWGYIGDLRVWNVARTGPQIADNYNRIGLLPWTVNSGNVKLQDDNIFDTRDPGGNVITTITSFSTTGNILLVGNTAGVSEGMFIDAESGWLANANVYVISVNSPGNVTVSAANTSAVSGNVTFFHPTIFESVNEAYSDFLKEYGIWEPTKFGANFSRTYEVNFPSSGMYDFVASADDYGNVLLDGTEILKVDGFTETYRTIEYVTQGYHTVKFNGINTGGQGSFGLVIDGAFDGGDGGYSGPPSQISTPYNRFEEFKTPGRYTWTVPEGVSSVAVKLIGAGGGGGLGRGTNEFYPVTHGGWGSFMNTYAIWKAETKSWNGWFTTLGKVYFTANINFPSTGNYIFQVSSDNQGVWNVDDGVNYSTASGAYTSFTQRTLNLTEGLHNIDFTVTNTGGPGGLAMNVIEVSSGTSIWNTRDEILAGGAGGGGSGGKHYATIPVTPGDTMTLVVGQKGEGATLLGNVGSDGGSTTLTYGNLFIDVQGGQNGENAGYYKGYIQRFSCNLAITGNVTNYDVSKAARTVGWDGKRQLVANVTLDSNIVVGSTSRNRPALDTGILPVGSLVTLNIPQDSFIVGKGGDGADQQRNDTNGDDGGDALWLRSLTVINNNGVIGGGGGGGGGFRASDGYINGVYFGGGGGGGGAGYTFGKAGDTFGFHVINYDTAGNANVTIPDGVTFIKVKITGAGGGGGGGGFDANAANSFDSSTSGGGGGSGYTNEANITVTPGETLVFQVGQGGAGGTVHVSTANLAISDNGGDGTPTRIWRGGNILLQANAGSGGGGGVSNVVPSGGAGYHRGFPGFVIKQGTVAGGFGGSSKLASGGAGFRTVDQPGGDGRQGSGGAGGGARDWPVVRAEENKATAGGRGGDGYITLTMPLSEQELPDDGEVDAGGMGGYGNVKQGGAGGDLGEAGEDTYEHQSTILWNFNSASYTLGIDTTVKAYTTISGMSKPGMLTPNVAIFGISDAGNLTVTNGAGYTRTITSTNKINLVNETYLTFQILEGGGGWGERPDQGNNDFVYIEYSSTGSSWTTIKTFQPYQYARNRWENVKVAVPSGARVAGGVYLRFRNSGVASVGASMPRDTWALTSIKSAVLRGGKGGKPGRAIVGSQVIIGNINGNGAVYGNVVTNDFQAAPAPLVYVNYAGKGGEPGNVFVNGELIATGKGTRGQDGQTVLNPGHGQGGAGGDLTDNSGSAGRGGIGGYKWTAAPYIQRNNGANATGYGAGGGGGGGYGAPDIWRRYRINVWGGIWNRSYAWNWINTNWNVFGWNGYYNWGYGWSPRIYREWNGFTGYWWVHYPYHSLDTPHHGAGGDGGVGYVSFTYVQNVITYEGGTAGGGGGGGAASAIVKGNTPLVVAAGGGGGGGGGWLSRGWAWDGRYGFWGFLRYSWSSIWYYPTEYISTTVGNPLNIANGWFTRTGALQTDPTTAVREYVIRYNGRTVYRSRHYPPAQYRPGGYRGSAAPSTMPLGIHDYANAFDLVVTRSWFSGVWRWYDNYWYRWWRRGRVGFYKLEDGGGGGGGGGGYPTGGLGGGTTAGRNGGMSGRNGESYYGNTFTVSTHTNGGVGGKGGLGTAGQAGYVQLTIPTLNITGAAGGGGAGSSIGSTGSAVLSPTVNTLLNAPGTANLTVGGFAGNVVDLATNVAITSGRGGNLGSAGQSLTTIATGGQAGRYIVGNTFVTWSNVGTRLGGSA